MVNKILYLNEQQAVNLSEEVYKAFEAEMDKLRVMLEQEQGEVPEEPAPWPPQPGYVYNGWRVPPTWPSAQELSDMIRDVNRYPLMTDVAEEIGVSDRQVRTMKSMYTQKAGVPPSMFVRTETKREERRSGTPTNFGGMGASMAPRINDVQAFPGQFYRDHTRLPRRRWTLLGSKTSVQQRRRGITTALTYFRKIFLLGYELSNSRLFYELWYDTHTGEYIVYDHNAIPSRQKFKIMNDAISFLIFIVSENDPNIDVESLNKRDAFSLRKHAFSSKSSAEREAAMSESYKPSLNDLLESCSHREKFLSENVHALKMFQDIVNSELVQTYDNSRMSKYLASRKFWQTFGRDVELPPTPLGRFRKAGLIIRGLFTDTTIREGHFLYGVTVANRIDIEVWEIFEYEALQRGRTSRSSFAVFDLTQGRVIGDGIPTEREALAIAYRKVAVKV